MPSKDTHILSRAARPESKDTVGFRATAAVLFALALAGTAQAAPLDMPPGASSCSGCHAASAAVATPVPPLAGRDPAEIVAAMQAFRSGQRPATVMDRIAKGFSDDEVAAIASWYHAQPQ